MLYAALASREEDQDPIDDAIIAKAKGMAGFAALVGGLQGHLLQALRPRLEEDRGDGGRPKGQSFQVSKGAPQVILALLQNSADVEKEVTESIGKFASKGYRALGVARTDEREGWQYVGLIALSDPPRDDSAATIATAQSMGIEVKMVTGDHVAIAEEVSRLVGLGTNIITAASIVGKPDRRRSRLRRGRTGSPRSSRSTSTASSSSCRRRTTSSA